MTQLQDSTRRPPVRPRERRRRADLVPQFRDDHQGHGGLDRRRALPHGNAHPGGLLAAVARAPRRARGVLRARGRARHRLRLGALPGGSGRIRVPPERHRAHVPRSHGGAHPDVRRTGRRRGLLPGSRAPCGRPRASPARPGGRRCDQAGRRAVQQRARRPAARRVTDEPRITGHDEHMAFLHDDARELLRMRIDLRGEIPPPSWPEGSRCAASTPPTAPACTRLLEHGYRRGGGSVEPSRPGCRRSLGDSEFDPQLCFLVEVGDELVGRGHLLDERLREGHRRARDVAAARARRGTPAARLPHVPGARRDARRAQGAGAERPGDPPLRARRHAHGRAPQREPYARLGAEVARAGSRRSPAQSRAGARGPGTT